MGLSVCAAHLHLVSTPCLHTLSATLRLRTPSLRFVESEAEAAEVHQARPLVLVLGAPSEARRFLRGASPRRVRISHPLVPSVGTMEEESNPNEVV